MAPQDAGYEFCNEEELVRTFKTNAAQGMTSSAAAQKLEEDGLNELYKPPRPTLFALFVAQLCGFIIVLLIIAAIASIIVNATGSKKDDILSYTTGMAIFVIVLLNAGIAAYTENQAGGALEALAKMSQPCITVVRDGREQQIDTTTVVVGDLVLLETGDVVPADVRLIEAMDVKVAEMCLTGEPDDVAKNAKVKQKITNPNEPEKLTPENMIFSSTNCTSGKGRGIVVATGMKTRIGEIAAHLTGGPGAKQATRCGCLPDTSANQTPLQVNVEKLGAKIGVGAIAVCIAVFLIGLIINTRDPDNPDNPSWLYMILIAVTLAVAAIPEGIPLCVTISLSIGSSSMVKEHVLVRKLAAVETLGSASVICSDKTGTLTEGKMTMKHLWAGGVSYDVSGAGFDPTVGKVTRSQGGADANTDCVVRSTLLTGLLCSNTSLSQETDPDTGRKAWVPKGNSSEAPIVVAARKVGWSTEKTDKEYRRVVEVPFSSSRKMMLTAVEVSSRDALFDGGVKLAPGVKYVAICKGAPNYIIEECQTMIDQNGNAQPLTASEKDNVMKVIDDYSGQALRVLAIAIHPMASLGFDPQDEDVNAETKFQNCRKDLQLVGLVASIDPERQGVKDSVNDARGASIRVVMITGDYLKTAVAIAKNITILTADEGEEAACDCAKLRPGGEYISEAEMDALTQATRCFARAKPEDKMEIVKSFQRQGLVCAMTGDGVNDAPALNQADIGVAMGIQGTEVAKGASKMVLTDDNFCSIVKAVERGRVIYAGIQKFVAFIMSVHIAEVLQIFVCVVANIPVMRTPLQILFLILVTDLPPSIALGMEPGDRSILKNRPRPKEEPIMLGWMWMSSIVNGAILTAVIIGVYVLCLIHFCEGQIFQNDILMLDGFEEKLANARTVAFISLVFSENIRAYISRSFEKHCWVNFLGNVHMQKAIVAAQIALLCAVLVPFFSDKILGLRGISIGIWGWIVSLLGPLGTLILCELYKILTQYQVQQYQEQLRLKAEAEEEKFRQEHPPWKKTGSDGIKAHDVQITFHDGKQNGISKSDSHGRGKSGKSGGTSWTKALCCPFVGSGRTA